MSIDAALRRIATAVMVAALAVIATAALAHAVVDPALNGTYTVTSDGQWAKTNEVFHDEATVVAIWSITSTCSDAYDCKGTVTTDQGWSADIVYISRMWFVTRTLDSWVRCPDGQTAPGKQIYKFYEDLNAKGRYVGWDATTGPSGACGINRPLYVEIPLTVVPR